MRHFHTHDSDLPYRTSCFRNPCGFGWIRDSTLLPAAVIVLHLHRERLDAVLAPVFVCFVDQLQIGTDDADGLAAFLQSKLKPAGGV